MTRKPKDETKLMVIVPCYNEEEALPVTAPKLLDKLKRLIAKGMVSKESKILFVDDGSLDGTWQIIADLHDKNKKYNGIRLAANRGHQNALLAGLMFARERAADVTISIDADLQQDVEAMDEFLDTYYGGSEIVYGVRNSRDTDKLLKRATAGAFYRFMSLMGVKIRKDSADYRLLSANAIDALSEYGEVNLFLRGIIPDIGMKSGVVHFDVAPRQQGRSKYTLRKMIRLAMDGVFSFSITPIHLIAVMGVLFVIASIVMIIYFIIDYLLGNTEPGYPTILCSLWFIGGFLMFALGIVGEYVGRSYQEAKKRPRYFLDDMYFSDDARLAEDSKETA